ncbi:ArnT family glycosyltransferase [Rhodococcus pyridinivorans]|uniref:Glycosyltransferase family 39 protein n=1 Tax=Rhodococcus pyridinivorans TaxID=103816 RepID=A0A7M2XX63_9NOCA|nr:glycosyltransferase family 39 protein [Rhodococcus pyridinivorans]QOW01933.1 glycosyltransferase family 39 protein [Rhodococcus pyridinivorans]
MTSTPEVRDNSPVSKKHDTVVQEAPGSELPSLARKPVYSIAALAAVVLVATSSRVGYFGDELYFLVAGRNLDWGYADQGPLVPLLALLMDTVVPDSLVALRFPMAIVVAVGVVVAALTARELGGLRQAQAWTGAAYAMSSVTFSHTLNTATVDMLMWTVVTWLLVRWTRTRDDKLLLAIGAVTALALQNKWLIVALWLAVGISVLADGPRDLLRRPMLWAAAALTAVITIPALIWQATHGWPQISTAQAIPNEDFLNYRLVFLPLVLASAGFVFGAALLIYGAWRLLRSPQLRAYRFLGLAFVELAVLFQVVGGRHTYLPGLFVVCWAAGAVESQRHTPSRWIRWAFHRSAIAVSALVALTWLPILPTSWPTPARPMSLLMLGLPEWTDTVADAFGDLPPETREGAVVVTHWYWDAAVVDRYGPERGLPESYSTHRGAWDFGPPPEGTDTVLFIDSDADYLEQYFTEVQLLTSVDTGGMTNMFDRPIPVWLCSGPKDSWAQMWTDLRHF